jgi:ADP-ribose pyrophosphatase YjhB (NUDIX family)
MRTKEVADRPRRVCSGCGVVYFPDPKVGVGAVVVRDGQLLLVRRAMHPEIGRWSVPAGFLDPGEHPRDAAAREVLEETGVTVAVGDLLEIFSSPPAGGASLFLLYDAVYVGGEPRAGDDVDGAEFFGRSQLPELAFPSTYAAVRYLAERERG